MDRSREWLVPLTGVVFIVLLFVGFAVMGEPPSADDPVREIVDYYLDDKDAIQIGAILGVVAGVFLIYFGGYLRRFLRAATGDESSLPQIAFLGLVIVAIGGAIDGTLSFAMVEAADDIEPATLQGIQAIWDNDFLPFALGILCFLSATGLAIVRTGVLPKWLGWLILLLAVVGPTPIGFASAIGSAVLVLVLSIWMSVRARGASAPPTPPAAPAAP